MPVEPVAVTDVGTLDELPPEMLSRGAFGRPSKWVGLHAWLKNIPLDNKWHIISLPTPETVVKAQSVVRGFVRRNDWPHNFETRSDKENKYLDKGYTLAVRAIKHTKKP